MSTYEISNRNKSKLILFCYCLILSYFNLYCIEQSFLRRNYKTIF